MPAYVPPTADQVALLRVVASRKIPGPLVRTRDRDRLFRLGFIAADQQTGTRTDGQARIWRITPAGETFLAECVQ